MGVRSRRDRKKRNIITISTLKINNKPNNKKKKFPRRKTTKLKYKKTTKKFLKIFPTLTKKNLKGAFQSLTRPKSQLKNKTTK